MTVVRRVARAALAVAASLLVVATWGDACAPVYAFPDAHPFSGSTWYNPYDVSPGSGWHVANFHAHSIAWGGLTNGHQPPAEVRAAYRRLGAEIAGISNYHLIDTTGAGADSTWIPTYEYGYSVPKSHRLVLGAREVQYLEAPVGERRGLKQYILDRLRPTAALTAINHPVMRHGHTEDDLRALGNYDLVEAISSYGDSPAEWDAALSTGHHAWAIGSDDNHDITRTDLLGRCWTMVLAPSTRASVVLGALKQGRMYAVRGAAMRMDNGVRAVTMAGDTLAIVLDRAARRVRFVGDNGRELAVASDVAEARYVARPADSYVRIVVENAATSFWLNPVVRAGAGLMLDIEPVEDAGATWALRIGLLVLAFLLVAGLRRLGRPA
ncbi:MAG: hypothetical protein HY275_10005 [Gemmatimonadetes bacterium]|nr:hypothetical protein [Gemmatimonadota bacterium]